MMDGQELAFIRQEIACAIRDGLDVLTRPHIAQRATILRDGSRWIAMTENGSVCGEGNTPAKACEAFDLAWIAPQGKHDL